VARGISYPESARLAARVGYAGIDNWGLTQAKEAGVEATRAFFAELNVKPHILNIPGGAPWNGDDAAFEARLPQIEQDASFCSAIGCSNFMVVLGATAPRPKAEQWKLATARLGAVSGILEKHNMRLGLEFLGPLHFRTGRGGGGGRGRGGRGRGGEAGAPAAPAAPPAPPEVFVYTLEETVRLATESGPAIGAVLDFWHWHHSGGTIDDILATDPRRIVNVHISDAAAMPAEQVQDSNRLLPGEGIIDLVGGLQALRKIGWQGGLCPETIGPRIPADMPPEESARLALEATRAVMRRAGVL
jgi:sugar phosphate isomerase/epimerase